MGFGSRRRFSRTVALAVALLLAESFGAIVAADSARYSLGSVQQEDELRVVAGGVVTTRLLFYNIDGNLPTELRLTVLDAPAEWSVGFERGQGELQDAIAVSLLVEPSSAAPQPAACSGSDREEIYLPSRGYVCADVVGVRIAVPADAAGMVGSVRLGTVASWQVDGAAMPFPQEREFVYRVAVEEPLSAPGSAADGPESAGPLSLAAAGGLTAGLVLLMRRLLVKSGRVA